MKIFRILLLSLFTTLCLALGAQDVMRTVIYNKAIKTPQMYLNGVELSGAYLDLKGVTPIALHFDELGTDYKNYQYSLLHCNSDWTPSSLLPQEYIDGYFEDYITTYSTSFNTLQEYLHYTVNIPNENMKLKKSGNYIVKVFEVGNSDAPAFTMRFVVYENIARVTTMIKRSDIVQERETLQEIDFNIVPPFNITNPYTDLKITILQNNRWDNAIRGLTPTFVRDNELVFNYDRKSSFPGGNEYRQIDLKSFRYQTGRVAKIVQADGAYQVKLVNDIVRNIYPYGSYQDLNGGYVIKNDDGTGGNPNNDGDYASVTFTLPHEAVTSGILYIAGDFNQNRLTEENQMKYNYNIGAYECTMLLKQGYYNYQYVLVKDKQQPDASFIEGAFFQTENNYTILIYYRDFSTDYDRVIGCYTANSMRGN
ncbi:MAG: DUF5103 domain-containing protein [Bacteroidota bacterium]